MSKSEHKQIEKWIYSKLEENPNKFGSDGCNALFMKTYLWEHYNIDAPISLMQAISTVSRKKSKVLLDNPHFDRRKKDRAKGRKNIHK